MAGERAIILMGLRGSGKTTVGRLLAERLSRRFIDLDDRTLSIIRSEHGVCSIARAFTELGEAVFRRVEIEALGYALTELSDQPPCSRSEAERRLLLAHQNCWERAGLNWCICATRPIRSERVCEARSMIVAPP